jgi:hypothetical protein
LGHEAPFRVMPVTSRVRAARRPPSVRPCAPRAPIGLGSRQTARCRIIGHDAPPFRLNHNVPWAEALRAVFASLECNAYTQAPTLQPDVEQRHNAGAFVYSR